MLDDPAHSGDTDRIAEGETNVSLRADQLELRRISRQTNALESCRFECGQPPPSQRPFLDDDDILGRGTAARSPQATRQIVEADIENLLTFPPTAQTANGGEQMTLATLQQRFQPYLVVVLDQRPKVIGLLLVPPKIAFVRDAISNHVARAYRRAGVEPQRSPIRRKNL